MDISPFIQTAFGAIVGGGVVIATNWLNTAREKRKEIQEWYEQRYVTEGLDPLIAYFTNLALRFPNPLPNEIARIPDATIPVEALTRIEVLLGVNGGMEYLGVFIVHINRHLSSGDYEDYQEMAIEPLFELCKMLYELRQEVLERIPKEIHRKNQKLDVEQHRNRILIRTRTFVEEALLARKHPPTTHIPLDMTGLLGKPLAGSPEITGE